MLIALRFYVNGSFLQAMRDTVGVDKSTVSLVVNLLCRMSMFSSNFSVKTEISDGEKFDLRPFFAGEAILNKRFPAILSRKLAQNKLQLIDIIHFTLNRGLVNRRTNLLLNNGFLTLD